MLSVLMSVYESDNPEYLERALTSVWDDQIVKPSQIVLVKDGPLTAELDTVVQRWKLKLDAILTLVELARNVGLGAALNAGLKACRSELVARMDADDVSLPERFQRQLAFMGVNPSISVVSAQLEEWDVHLEHCFGKRNVPLHSLEILEFAKRRSPMSHPLTVFRKSCVESVGGYPSLRKAQDYALWSLMLCKGFKMANLPDTLLKMRTGNEMMSRRGFEYFKHEIKLLKFQRGIGFLSRKEYVVNFVLKALLRLSPSVVRSLAYRFAR